MIDTQHPVVIVGAGPAGAALALLLARRGIPVTLLERHAKLDREFRGEGLQQSGLACLAQMGLADEIEHLPQTRLRGARFASGHRVVHLSEKALGIASIRVVSQPPLLALLTRKAAEHPGFSLRMGARVRDLVREPGTGTGRITGVRVDRHGSTGDEIIPASLVIGADGRSAITRKKAGIELRSIEQSFDVLWARGDLGDFLPAGVAHTEILRDGGMALVFPSPLGGQQIGVIIEKGGFRELRARGEAESFAWVAERCSPGLARALTRAGERMGRPVLLDVICGRATRWTAPGLLLIGDAAHPMSPVGGQGINMALRDAVVAANHLVPVLRAGADPAALDAAAARVEAERTPEIAAVQRLQTREARRLRRRPGPLATALLPHLVRLAPVLQWLGHRRRRMQRGIASVELRV